MANGLASNQGFLQLIIDNVYLGTSAFTVKSRGQFETIIKTVYEGVLKGKSCRRTGLPDTIIEYRDTNGVFFKRNCDIQKTQN